jgi:hypothetical protein
MILTEENFEKIIASLYPGYHISKERARFYLNQGELKEPLEVNLPDEYNSEQIFINS